MIEAELIEPAGDSAKHYVDLLRAADPAPISGLDALLVNQVYFYDDPARFTGSVNAIADELSLSVKTISTHKTRILQKMNLSNAAELIHYAIRHQLLEPSGE